MMHVIGSRGIFHHVDQFKSTVMYRVKFDLISPGSDTVVDGTNHPIITLKGDTWLKLVRT